MGTAMAEVLSRLRWRFPTFCNQRRSIFARHRYVTQLERVQTRRYLEMFYALQYRQPADRVG